MTGQVYRSPAGIGIDHLLRQGAVRTPAKAAIVDDRGSISYGEAEVASNRLARWLVANGVRRGDRVALILPNGIPFIVGELAILRLGAVKVPLNIRGPYRHDGLRRARAGRTLAPAFAHRHGCG
jgi:acyl-CoA synthetase (AMP-forming)/AMP-acid ligase II